MNSGIYSWTSPNGKIYIGQSVNLKRRKKEFYRNKYYVKKGTAIDNARECYNNLDDWKYNIIELCDESELDNKEIYYISKYNSVENGYNMSTGGSGTHGRCFLSEESKKNISDKSKQRHKDGVYDEYKKSEKCKEVARRTHLGKKLSDETKEKLRQCNLGKHYSDDVKLKLSEISKKRFESGWINTGQIKAVSKKVYQYTLDGQFIRMYDSMNQASKAYGGLKQIRAVCQGKRDSYKDYIWRFTMEGSSLLRL